MKTLKHKILEIIYKNPNIGQKKLSSLIPDTAKLTINTYLNMLKKSKMIESLEYNKYNITDLGIKEIGINKEEAKIDLNKNSNSSEIVISYKDIKIIIPSNKAEEDIIKIILELKNKL